MNKKNICYISDNRTGANWGAKATSIALHDLLLKHYSISNTIFNTYKTKEYLIGFLIFKRYFIHKSFFSRKYISIKNIILQTLLKLGFAEEIDIRSNDIDKNINYFIKYNNADNDLTFLMDSITRCDEIVINGEGDMILSGERKTLNFLLTIMNIAYLNGKKVHFLNAMISPCPINGVNENNLHQCIKTLRKCSNIQIRDIESIKFLNKIAPDVKANLVPDALFTWYNKIENITPNVLLDGDIIIPHRYEKAFGLYNFKLPYICISGTSLAPRVDKDELIKSYVLLVEKLKNAFVNYNLFLVIPCNGDLFLNEVGKFTNVPVIPVETSLLIGAKVLSNSSLYISGRYHPSIMASLGGTPCISLVSNSHKMVGLQKLLGYKTITHFSVPLEPNNISEIIELSSQYLADKTIKANIIEKVKIFSNEAIENIVLN